MAQHNKGKDLGPNQQQQYQVDQDTEDEEESSNTLDEESSISEEAQTPQVRTAQGNTRSQQNYIEEQKSVKCRQQSRPPNSHQKELSFCYTARIEGQANNQQSSKQGQPPQMRSQAWINQKNLQMKFLEQENQAMKQHIQDLECTLKINKEMLSTILLDTLGSEKDKAIVGNLNKENRQLIEKSKQMSKEKNELLANQLIHQQIIENMKIKEEENNQMNEEQLKGLQEKLEKKEYSLQVTELKIYHYEKYLQRKALTEKESRQLLFKFQQDDPKEAIVKISNVVDDNAILKAELKEAFQEVNRLQEQCNDLSSKVDELQSQIKHQQEGNNPAQDPELSIFDQTNISTANGESQVDLEKLKRMEKYFPKEYQQRLELMLLDMEKQLKSLKKERKYLKSENTILKESNESNQYMIQKLNSALSKATDRFKALEEKQASNQKPNQQQRRTLASPPNNRKTEKVSLGIDDIDDNVLNQLKKRELERKKEAEREGLDPDEFGNLSSIMINPNEISNAIYGSNVLGSVRGSGAPFNFAKELEIDDKKRGNT